MATTSEIAGALVATTTVRPEEPLATVSIMPSPPPPQPDLSLKANKSVVALGIVAYVAVLAVMLGWAFWLRREHARRNARDPDWVTNRRRLNLKEKVPSVEEVETQELRPLGAEGSESEESKTSPEESRKSSATSVAKGEEVQGEGADMV